MALIAWLCCITLCIQFCLSYYTVPEVEINLDLPASERWMVAIDAILTKHSWNDTFGTVFQQANQSTFNVVPPSDYKIYSSAIQRNWPDNVRNLPNTLLHIIYIAMHTVRRIAGYFSIFRIKI